MVKLKVLLFRLLIRFNLVDKINWLRNCLSGQRPRSGVVLVSFPKSGRTWLRMILDKLNVNLIYTHDGTDEGAKLPYDKLPDGPARYKNKKVIFLVRDPKDVVVSEYFQATKRTGIYGGPISEFVEDPRFGIRKILTFWKKWEGGKHLTKDFLLISYEDMKEDTEREVRRILDFIEDNSINEKEVREAIDFAKFDKMQAREKKKSKERRKSLGDYFRLDPGKDKAKDVSDKESFKARKGQVGGHTDYLSEESISYCDRVIQEMGNPLRQ